MIHLDTSFLIGSMAPASREYLRLRQWVQAGTEIRTSAVTWGEFLCGPLSPQQLLIAQRIIGEPLPFTRLEAERAADLLNMTGRRRGTFADCMIAATAMAAGASIAKIVTTSFVSTHLD